VPKGHGLLVNVKGGAGVIRIAAIDIGTNSVRLLVADLCDSSLQPIYKDLQTTRLGKGVDSEGILSEKAMDNTLEAVKGFKDISLSMGAEDILVMATSAVRDAKNGTKFVSKIQELGLIVRILSGEDEAELGFLGASAGIKNIEGKILTVDIGGGSTELVLGTKGHIDCLTSINIGAVRLTERYAKSDPIKPVELERAAKHVKDALDEIKFGKIINNATMVGIGGTVTSLASIDQAMIVYNRELIHGYHLSKSRVVGILNRLAGLSLEERQKVPGLQPKRADIIVMGIVILKCIMEFNKLDSIFVSEWDNLEGLVYKRYIPHHKLP
jgi:exopolyphosphatase/guanosine-5'-triphosphate,3'-diphosphate pyrophosphatase